MHVGAFGWALVVNHFTHMLHLGSLGLQSILNNMPLNLLFLSVSWEDVLVGFMHSNPILFLLQAIPYDHACQ